MKTTLTTLITGTILASLIVMFGAVGVVNADIESPEDRAYWRSTLAPDPDLKLCAVQRNLFPTAEGYVKVDGYPTDYVRPNGGYCHGEYERK